MKKITLKIILSGLMVTLLLGSCKKQLDIPSRNALVGTFALNSKSGIENSINSIYSILKRESFYGRDLFSVTDAMADIAFANGRSSRLLGENRNNSGSNVNIWNGAYAAINECNLTLAAFPAIDNATAAEKARWEGELKFLRALYLFELVRNYAYIPTYVVPGQDKGGVVINLEAFITSAAAIANTPSRATIAACYAQIMADLYSAVGLLTNTNKGRNYASKHAALALGSRVNLYAGNWAKADSFATAAITLPTVIGAMTTTTSYETGWRVADHPEGIFQIWYSTIAENLGVNTSLAATHTTLSLPGASLSTRQGQGDLVPNAFLLTQLGISGFPAALVKSPPTTPLTYSSDIRNKMFEWGVNATGHYVECTKWMGKNGSPNWDNTVVIRWPELYLNRAEARYHLLNEPGAMADLNVIRTARIVGFTPPATLTGAPLLAEILRQRMLEYAFEGHRFYDLKRYGTTITKSNPVTNLPATDFRLLPRIPQSEIDGNPNMVQNFGY